MNLSINKYEFVNSLNLCGCHLITPQSNKPRTVSKHLPNTENKLTRLSVPMEELERTKIRNSGSQLVLMRHRDVLLM